MKLLGWILLVVLVALTGVLLATVGVFISLLVGSEMPMYLMFLLACGAFGLALTADRWYS